MPSPAQPDLVPGRVYRTHEFTRWGANPTRLAKRLLREGRLRRLAPGLFFAPQASRFGPTPPEEREVLRGFLETEDFIITGPPVWNALGLGTTGLFAATLVYNRKRSGEFLLGNLRFLLRRVRYPEKPVPEWFVIDLLEHPAMAGAELGRLEAALRKALSEDRFDRTRLQAMAGEYATLATRQLVDRCLERSTH
ncbi:MAG: hypothetical protein HY901_14675 [Deltaproteobacteria bacterium]|nr:hypothetical protein [Deltaproteobacteria bacterium]